MGKPGDQMIDYSVSQTRGVFNGGGGGVKY